MNALRRFVSLTFVGLLFVGWTGSAWADETTLCTAITSLPYTITVQGLYCLKQDFDGGGLASGNAIEIQTNDVVVDLNGHKIGNLGAGPLTTAIGVYALNRKNITIKNGTLRGFRAAIQLDDTGASEGHVIEDLRVDFSTVFGILVGGRGNIIRNNLVTETGGVVNSYAYGIDVLGPGNRIINNHVANVLGTVTQPAYGISALFPTGNVVENNQVGNTNATLPGNSSTGIYTAFGDGLVVNNRITNWDNGIVFIGVGVYHENILFNVTTPYTGGTAFAPNSP